MVLQFSEFVIIHVDIQKQKKTNTHTLNDAGADLKAVESKNDSMSSYINRPRSGGSSYCRSHRLWMLKMILE